MVVVETDSLEGLDSAGRSHRWMEVPNERCSSKGRKGKKECVVEYLNVLTFVKYQ